MAEVLAAYVRVRWSLARNDVSSTVAALRASRPHATREATGFDDQLVGQRLGHAVRRTLTPLPSDSRCLVSSLTLTTLLARRGIRTSLVIGVRSAPTFEAHAWVEHHGVPLTPAGGDAFQRLMEL